MSGQPQAGDVEALAGVIRGEIKRRTWPVLSLPGQPRGGMLGATEHDIARAVLTSPEHAAIVDAEITRRALAAGGVDGAAEALGCRRWDPGHGLYEVCREHDEEWPCSLAKRVAAVIDAARDEWRAPITDALEMAEHTTHGVMRARLDEVLDVITSYRDADHEHQECPVWCDDCERWERPRTCEHCNGSGCGPGTALGAYEECEWCAGDGREHEPDPAVRDQGGATDRTNDPTERNRT